MLYVSSDFCDSLLFADLFLIDHIWRGFESHQRIWIFFQIFPQSPTVTLNMANWIFLNINIHNQVEIWLNLAGGIQSMNCAIILPFYVLLIKTFSNNSKTPGWTLKIFCLCDSMIKLQAKMALKNSQNKVPISASEIPYESREVQSCAKKYRKIGLYVVKWP